MKKIIYIYLFIYCTTCFGTTDIKKNECQSVIDFAKNFTEIYQDTSSSIVEKDQKILKLVGAIPKIEPGNNENNIFSGRYQYGYSSISSGFHTPLPKYIESIIWIKPGEISIGIDKSHCLNREKIIEISKIFSVSSEIEKNNFPPTGPALVAKEGVWRLHTFIDTGMGDAILTLIPKTKTEIKIFFTRPGRFPECAFRIDITNN